MINTYDFIRLLLNLSMELTDTHCHLDLNRFDKDRLSVLSNALREGINRILIPGLTESSSMNVVKLANNHPITYAAVGVHPNEATTWNAKSQKSLEKLAQNFKVVAIGEIGLDYYHGHSSPDLQKKVLQEQLELAAMIGLPVVLHLREKNDDNMSAASDLFKIMDKWISDLKSASKTIPKLLGVMHSYSGSLDWAMEAVRLGFLIGVTGPITFKNSKRRQEVISSLPLEKLLIETDAPFLTPHPYRGKRNEPAFVKYIAEKLAKLHSRLVEEIASITTTNARNLFAWGEMI